MSAVDGAGPTDGGEPGASVHIEIDPSRKSVLSSHTLTRTGLPAFASTRALQGRAYFRGLCHQDALGTEARHDLVIGAAAEGRPRR